MLSIMFPPSLIGQRSSILQVAGRRFSFELSELLEMFVKLALIVESLRRLLDLLLFTWME